MIKWRGGSFISVLFAVLLISTVSSHAEMELRGVDSLGNRLIYDSDLNITWYDYTKSYDTWQNQMNWATSLSVNFSGAIYDDWRLPITFTQTCSGANCLNSEMGHLYYTELGNSAYAFTNTGYFQHLETNNGYWSGTEADPYNEYNAWSFGFLWGLQSTNYKGFAGAGNGLAVRSGLAVPGSPVAPEPISSVLFFSGGSLLAGRRYIKKKNRA